MNLIENRQSEFAAQQAHAKVSLAPMMLLDDEALKHVSGGGPAGSWSDAIVKAPAGSW